MVGFGVFGELSSHRDFTFCAHDAELLRIMRRIPPLLLCPNASPQRPGRLYDRWEIVLQSQMSMAGHYLLGFAFLGAGNSVRHIKNDDF